MQLRLLGCGAEAHARVTTPLRHQGRLLDLPGRERLRHHRDRPRRPPRRRPRRWGHRLDRLPGDQRSVPGQLRWRPRRRLPGPAQPQRVASAVRQLPGRQRRGRQRGAGSWLDGKGNWFIPGATSSTDFPVTPGAYQNENAGAFDAFLVKVDLDKRHKGSGQRARSVTVESSGPREGLTRDRIARR